MRRLFFPALAPAALVLLFAACDRGTPASAEPSSGQGIAFAAIDVDAALSRARSEKKLVMVDVYTDWCGWCRRMDRDVFQDARVAGAAKKLVAVRVNAENGGEQFAEKFQVDGFPTILFLDGEGRLVKRIDGYVGPDTMLRVLQALPETGA